MERHWVFGAALVLGAAAVVGACSGTSGGNGPSTPDTDADTDASGDAVADASGPVEASPDAGSPDAGETGAKSDGGDAATTNEGGEAGADGQAEGGGGPADAGDASDGSTAFATPYAIFAGTDFNSSELSVVSLNPGTVAGTLPMADYDTVACASNGLGFVLERSLGDVLSLDPVHPWSARATIDVNDSPEAGSYESNPHAVVVTAGTKAYVARYASNAVKIVDVASGASTGTIDLSAYVGSDDPDGLVDVTDGVYDPASHRAYLLLQRINQYDYGTAPDYVGACLASHGEIVAVDSTTDAVVPLTDAGNGAIDLLGANPQALTPDLAHGRILVAEAGCYGYPDGGAEAGAALRFGRGVESVSLASATPSWLYQTSDVNLLSAVVLADSTHAYVEVGGDWFPWNPTQTTLGSAPLAQFPQAPVYDGNGRVVGLAASTDADGGVTWSVVAMAVSTGDVSTLAASPFHSVVPASAYGVSGALVR